MKRLAARVARELKVASHCAVYRTELERVWPKNGERREKAVRRWASRHRWRVRFYKEGFCAIFDKEPSSVDAAEGLVIRSRKLRKQTNKNVKAAKYLRKRTEGNI